MGQCVAKMEHEGCVNGSKNSLQVFEQENGKLDGFCYSCKSYVADPLGEGKSLDDIPKKERYKQSPEEIAAKIEEIGTYPVVDLRDRKLRANALDYYGIKIGLSEQDGKTPAFHYYPYTIDGELSSYKCRLIEGKKMWSVGDQTKVDLFGWEKARVSGAQRLIITEGELDAVALYAIFDRFTEQKYKHTTPAICSLPHGAGSAGRDLGRLLSKIKGKFKEISFCFDDDAAGRLAVEEASKIIPEATVISLPDKDANACVLAGPDVMKLAFDAAKWNHSKPKNTRLVSGEDLHEAAKTPAKWGVSWPWPALTELTRGIRTGETYYFGAGEKMGKSEIVNALAAHLIQEHGWSVLLAKPEEANVKSYKMILSKIVGKIFHDPKVAFDSKAYDEAGKVVDGKILLLDLYQHIGWETLKSDIIYSASTGVKAVFIDPITNLTNGMASSDINTFLQGVAQELAAMAKDYDIAIFIFCHLNKVPKGSKEWVMGARPTTGAFAGSSAMARSCNYCFGISGNKDVELPEEERNIRSIEILADREFGEVGIVRLFWNKLTGLFREI